jgi:hypothetical protein
MAKLIMWAFECPDCGEFEELCERCDELPCLRCGKPAKRVISGTRLDPKMGLTQDFPTMASRWEKKRKSQERYEARNE